MTASGEWSVHINDDESAVVVSFNHVGEDGVETFETAMPPDSALVFGAAVINHVLELR